MTKQEKQQIKLAVAAQCTLKKPHRHLATISSQDTISRCSELQLLQLLPALDRTLHGYKLQVSCTSAHRLDSFR
jgi:hypothetical protein